jgi:hypothetical protein
MSWKQCVNHPITPLKPCTWILVEGIQKAILDNALLKVQDQALADKNPKWKEWWQTI